MGKRIILAITSVLFISIIRLNAGSGIEIDIQHITTQHGLPANSVRSIFQDSRGFIWIGTINNGLCRYDGTEFTTFLPEYDSKPGLADSRISSIHEDGLGHLWIITMSEQVSCYDLKTERFVDYSGTGYFDGHYGHVSFLNDSVWLWGKSEGCMRVKINGDEFSSERFFADNNTLPSNHVTCMLEDSGIIWIGTKSGLCRYHDSNIERIVSDMHFVAGEKFDEGIQFISDKGHLWKVTDDGIAPNGRIAGIQENRSMITGTFSPDESRWMIFTTKGAYKYDVVDGVSCPAEYPYNLDNAEVKSDGGGNYLVYDKSGHVVFVATFESIEKPMDLISEGKGIFWTTRYGFTRTNDDIVWISTHENGLFAYDLSTDELHHYTMDRSKDSSPDNVLMGIMEDKSGNLWIGSEFSGIFKVKIINQGASYIHFGKNRDNEYADMVRMVKVHDNGEVWACTRDGKVYIYDDKLKYLKKELKYDANIYAACMNEKSGLWLGTRGKGLLVDGRRYSNVSEDPTSLSSDSIFAIAKDNQGDMWIGTFGGGLNLAMDDGKGGFIFRRFFNDTYSRRYIRSLCTDANGYMWVGSSNGILVFNPEDLKTDPSSYYSYNCQNHSLKSNECRSILCDSKGRIWVAETGSGFSVCQPDDYSSLVFEHFGTEDGLVNGIVQGFVEDDMGNMWITTEYGVSRFDTESKEFDNFLFSSNMQSNVCLDNSATKLKDGRILVGTNSGLAVIDPEEVELMVRDDVSHAVFTSFKVNGAEVVPGDEDSIMPYSVSYAPEISLRHNQNSFSLSFSSFDFEPGTLFRYKLEGYDDAWSAPTYIGKASYKQLPKGEYSFLVKACGFMGEWQEEPSTLHITVKPSFFMTPVAYIIYALIVLSVLFVTNKLLYRITTLKNEAKLEKQLTEYKLLFFTNVSHEFRTPLTLILHSLEKLRSSGSITEDNALAMRTLEAGTNRLMRLINQLLEFRKIQNNKHTLRLEQTEIISFCREIFDIFKETARQKHQELAFMCSEKEFSMYIDQGDMDKVIYNLVSNAVKYTPEGGRIEFTIRVLEPQKIVRFEVKDNGRGVPKEREKDIFTRFSPGESTESSMGVGLHLTKSLVDANKGNIRYCPNPDGGTIMTVDLPLDLSIYDASDFANVNDRPADLARDKADTLILMDENSMKKPVKPINPHKILVVDDEPEIRRLIVDELNGYFNIEEAFDGVSALEKLHNDNEIELVVCDVRMPGMSGYEVTSHIKEDISTCHIPVVLLTALDSDAKKLEGIQSGADSYITKPFRPDYVLTRILKLLEQRNRLREKFSNDLSVKAETICTNDIDRELMDKVDRIIEQNLDNPTFSMDEFASKMAMGRSSFYNKIHSVTGYTPNKYIRIVRMKKAAELILTGKYTGAEVAYKVGILDASYFSKSFKEHFGISPKAYYKKAMEGRIQDNSQDD